MAIGLFWNDNVHFDLHDWKMKFFWVGNNTGNLVFIRALKNIFNPRVFQRFKSVLNVILI